MQRTFQTRLKSSSSDKNIRDLFTDCVFSSDRCECWKQTEMLSCGNLKLLFFRIITLKSFTLLWLCVVLCFGCLCVITRKRLHSVRTDITRVPVSHTTADLLMIFQSLIWWYIFNVFFLFIICVWNFIISVNYGKCLYMEAQLFTSATN